jgi:hypothetical protein
MYSRDLIKRTSDGSFFHCHLNCSGRSVARSVGSATLDVDGCHIEGWCLEQSMLDAEHPVAVAVEPGDGPTSPTAFTFLKMEDVLQTSGERNVRSATCHSPVRLG